MSDQPLMARQQLYADKIAQEMGIKYGLDPITIISLVIGAIQLAVRCWLNYHPINLGTSHQQSFIRMHREDPVKVRAMLRRMIEQKLSCHSTTAKQLADEMMLVALDENNAEDFNTVMEQSQ